MFKVDPDRVVMPGDALPVAELVVMASATARALATTARLDPISLISLSELVSIRLIDEEHSSASGRLRFTGVSVDGPGEAGRFSPRIFKFDPEPEATAEPGSVPALSGPAIGLNSNIECS
jgi:hypothetical protein